MLHKRPSYSLRRRMIITSSLIITLFISLTVLVLDQAFKRSLQVDLQDRLQTQLYLVLGAAEFEANELLIPQQLNFPKLNQLHSGSIAFVLDDLGQLIWRSASSLGYEDSIFKQGVPVRGISVPPGSSNNGQFTLDSQNYFYTSLGVAWELAALTSVDSEQSQTRGNKKLKSYSLIIAEHSQRFEENINQYRMYLWFGLGILSLILLMVFTLTLYWGLSPLNTLADDLQLIETGKATQLTGYYPKELSAVSENLNRLLQHEKRQHTRYRNTLSNLAHSLKTPLAALRGMVDNYTLSRLKTLSSKQVDIIAQQVTRMDEIVQHQLHRAAQAGPQSVQQSIHVLPMMESLVNVIEKVYQDSIQCIDIKAESDVVFKGAKGDLMEVVGNLLDNAAKYGEGIIQLELENQFVDGEKLCCVRIEDNGQGIDENTMADILRRGVRADQKHQGQGIGLAMVVDIVDQYQGSLHMGKAELGGLKVEILI